MKTEPEAYILSGNSKGFTLIETLIAMAIFSIGILALGTMQLWSVKNNTTGNITTQATLLAKAKIEELKNTGDVTDLGPLDTEIDDPNNPIDTVGNAGGIYTRQWKITNPLDDNKTRRIQVTVSWNRRGQNRSVVLETITQGKGI